MVGRIDISPSEITTAQQKGAFVSSGRVRFFTKSKVRNCEKRICGALSGFVTKIDYDSAKPVRVVMEFLFPHTKGTPKCRLQPYSLMDKRPDVDNLAKSVLDCLTRTGLIADDSLVGTLVLRKRRTLGYPCVVFRIDNEVPDFVETWADDLHREATYDIYGTYDGRRL